VEQQLAEISATYSAETSPSMPVEETRLISEPETEFAPPEPVNYIPVEAESVGGSAAEAIQPNNAESEMPASDAHVEEVPPEPQGFFRRLLRRTTDY
jgi:hypothetical protein